MQQYLFCRVLPDKWKTTRNPCNSIDKVSGRPREKGVVVVIVREENVMVNVGRLAIKSWPARVSEFERRFDHDFCL